MPVTPALRRGSAFSESTVPRCSAYRLMLDVVFPCFSFQLQEQKGLWVRALRKTRQRAAVRRVRSMRRGGCIFVVS